MGALPVRGWEVISHMSRRRSTTVVSDRPKGTGATQTVRMCGKATTWLVTPSDDVRFSRRVGQAAGSGDVARGEA
eukprot:scaffold62796_cov72-Phaeocystis_antarctica.AAC.1